MTRQALSAEQIAVILQKNGPKSIHDVRTEVWAEGLKKTTVASIWLRTTPADLVATLETVIDIDYPHLAVVSGVDTGDAVELLYHMQVFYGIRGAEVNITIAVPVPKKNLVVPTISHLIPGAVYTEREKQEMLGVTVAGIPDPRGLFLPADFPEGVYPWRKDETGITEDMVNHLWASGRPGDRPAPPVKPKEKKVRKPKEPATENAASKETIPAESPASEPAPAPAPDAPDIADVPEPEVNTNGE
ncbi:NADH-quinone oxidoreductase subunit C [Methanogenium organophilum]|uniref:NADH-quinone oxidoreductase subunit C n=1 Tax=Methanogenium organophilum TaxID=2199 RepID=A0A9X9S4S7_METOG|nr:NADH-quinone oxidoreductase subunit C [Methanogenium organophilum]WAI01468.1 NADH-quinone oxidoreductase subunit C [Methanogenium organophilum]